MLRFRRNDDRGGVAIIAVISMGAALTIVLGALFVRSSSQMNAVGVDRSRQRSIQVADAGIDDAVARLSAAGVNLDSDTAFPELHGNGDSWDPAVPANIAGPDERAWVLAQAAAKPSARIQTSPHGQWVHIIPRPTVIPDSVPMQKKRLIYSVGYIPTKAAPKHTRVIRSEYDFTDSFAFEGAILTDGDLYITGTPDILGTEGSVHANGDLIIGGTPVISGSATAEEDCVGTVNTGDGKGCQAYQPHRAVPTIRPRNHWELSQFDLCPNGQVRKGPAHPSGTGVPDPDEDGVNPCDTGDVIGSGSGQGFNGWKFNSNPPQWFVSGANTTAADGVYYVYLATADVTGQKSDAPRWFATIIAEAKANGAERSHCPHFGLDTSKPGGDIRIAGNRRMSSHPSALGLLAVAGRDFTLTGNTTGARFYEGVMAAHEQFRVSGESQSNGIVMANDGCDTPGSPVNRTGTNQMGIHGNPTITHDGSLDPPFSVNDLRITRWLEL